MTKAELKQLIREVVNEARAPRVLPWHMKAAEKIGSGGMGTDYERIISTEDPAAKGKVLPWHTKVGIVIDGGEFDDSYDTFDEIRNKTAKIIALHDPASRTTPHDKPYTIEFPVGSITVYAANKQDAIKQAIGQIVKQIKFL
jgi:hypothetical protein